MGKPDSSANREQEGKSMAAMEPSITRRGLLRLGTLTVVGAAVLAGVGIKPSDASGPTYCKPDASGPYCNSERPTTPSDALDALLGSYDGTMGNVLWAGTETTPPTPGTTPPGLGASRRECVGGGQTPYAAILSCVDSRVPPEDVFYAGVGDLLVARVAGNSVVPILQDSLRYGADNLGALVLFVLGHSNCGAVSAAVSYYLEHIAHSSSESSVPELFSPHFHISDPDFAFIPPILPAVKVARRIVRKAGGNPDDPSQVVPVATNQHVILTVEYLSSQEPFSRLIRCNKLIVTGGVYNLASYLVNSPPPSGYPGTLS
jgi:Carbonic anhydrase